MKSLTLPDLARFAALTAALLIVPATAGCSTESASDDSAHDHGAGAESVTGAGAESVTVSDQWVKAADDGMTAVFGTFHNDGHHDARMVAATSPAAVTVELHEVVTDATGSSTMREKSDGFQIPAGGSHELVPGGDHLMLIDVTEPLLAGNDVSVVAVFDDGSAMPFTAQVRDFAGGDESYEPDSDPAQHEHG